MIKKKLAVVFHSLETGDAIKDVKIVKKYLKKLENLV